MSKANSESGRKWDASFGPFVPVPKAVVLDTTLSGMAKATYMLLLELAWRNGGGEAEVELPDAARYLATGEKTMRGYIRELERAGLVTSKRRGLGKSNAYTVHAPRGQDRPEQNGKNDRSVAADSAAVPAGASKDVEPDKDTDTTDADASVSARPAKVRKRDVVFDALAESCGCDPNLEGSEIARNATILRKHPDYLTVKAQQGRDVAEAALAEAIVQKARRYRRVYAPDITLTPRALVRNWKRVETMPERPYTPEEIAEGAHRGG